MDILQLKQVRRSDEPDKADREELKTKPLLSESDI